MWLDDPQYVAERDGYSYMHEGRKGEGVKPIKSQQLTVDLKKTCDAEYVKRSTAFMERAVKADKPFYCTSTTRCCISRWSRVPSSSAKARTANGAIAC
jgi:hypothetical protein